MKFFLKYIYWFLGTSLLLLLTFFCLVKEITSTKSSEALPRFYIETDAGDEYISIFQTEDEKYYVFLPSYADIKQLKVLLPPEKQVFLGDMKLSDGMTCSVFEVQTGYDFAMDEQILGELWFYQSANISTMHINTATGSMKYIHDSREYEEDVSITVYTAEGNVECLRINGQLKGRGNSTWNYEKRPYTITFPNGENLLGMGESMKWILLANAREEECLNNKIAFDLASRTGNEWTPENQWVDLYLNGEYSGLYLLAEKVEVGSQRLNINTDRGDFLGKIDYENRWDTLNSPFVSNAGRVVEISSPSIFTEKEKERIIDLINQMENIILSETNLSANSTIDLDSWICRYLIDEILGNIDSDLASSYFYYKDGIFYAGPIWDYDAILGNENSNQNPHSFIAKNKKKSEIDNSLYYDALYNNESFYSRMVEIYTEKFLPVLEQLIDEEIDEMASEISQSVQMNRLRWKEMYEIAGNENSNSVHTLKDIKDYLQQRVTFLNNAWINNVEYCTVQFENSRGNKYWNISVEKGSYLKTEYIDLENTNWVCENTGETIDFRYPISKDLVLVQPENRGFITSDYVVFFSIAVLIILFVGFVVLEIYGGYTKRRR